MKNLKMKRNNKILLGLLALLLVMSTGYALFSKEITVGGNVTAKGSFNVELTCTKSISNEFVTAGYYTTSEIAEMQHGYSTDTCTVSGSTVTVNTNLKYPGAARFYTLVMKNTGDITAKWNYIDGFTNNIQACYTIDGSSECENAPSKTYLTAANDYYEMLPSIRHTALKDASGTFTIIDGDDIEDVADSNGDIYLEPGESIYFFIYNIWDASMDDSEQNYAYGNYHTYTLGFNFTFEQATE